MSNDSLTAEAFSDVYFRGALKDIRQGLHTMFTLGKALEDDEKEVSLAPGTSPVPRDDFEKHFKAGLDRVKQALSTASGWDAGLLDLTLCSRLSEPPFDPPHLADGMIPVVTEHSSRRDRIDNLLWSLSELHRSMRASRGISQRLAALETAEASMQGHWLPPPPTAVNEVYSTEHEEQQLNTLPS